ncbi:hypothetical protein BBI17_009315, partial [Phytophthora kernoviae]
MRKSKRVFGPGYYYVGIIDILQTWTLQKKLERFWKVDIQQKDGESLSAIDPVRYQRRFESKLCEIIAIPKEYYRQHRNRPAKNAIMFESVQRLSPVLQAVAALRENAAAAKAVRRELARERDDSTGTDISGTSSSMAEDGDLEQAGRNPQPILLQLNQRLISTNSTRSQLSVLGLAVNYLAFCRPRYTVRLPSVATPMNSDQDMVSMNSFTSDNNQKAAIDSPSQALLGSAGTLPTTCKCDSRACSAHRLTKLTNALLYGAINSIRTIPAMYAYVLVIFSHPASTAYTLTLSKFVVFSSAVHQVIFTLLSSLPFAIGQVQDAGLIFLSTMVTSVCNSLGEDVPTEAKVITIVVTIGIATASLGVCLVVIWRLKLAAFTSYLPMPVVGGCLAFIGLFCLYTDLALCTGHVDNDFTSILKLFYNAHNVLLCLSGVVGGALLLLVSQQFRSPFALSTAIVVMPLFFFLVLAIGSISLDEARDDGWVDPIAESASISELINLFDFSLVHWDQVPKQIVTWINTVFIVTFSSSLDVVAIEIDMGSKLRTNHKLETVGWSNVVSGLLGGYTGSNIFSQTIFTCRYKTKTRIIDACVILSELAIVAVPVSVMSYVPRFFLAATLIFVALDLMLEWLVLAYHKMSLRECVVVWLSFLAINLISLDVGMLVGMGIAILNFLLEYVQESVVSNYPRSSATVRDLAKHQTLARKRDATMHFEFCGNLFF